MEQVQSGAARVAEAVSAQVVGLWDRVEDGSLTLDRFRLLAASLIARANATGVRVADVGLSRELGSRPLGLRPDEAAADRGRIAAGLDSVLAEQPSLADTPDMLAESRRARLDQFARSEPLISTANAVQSGLVRKDARWVRQLNPNACKICVGWADGVSRSPLTRMARHPGCGCIQNPVA